MKVELIRGAEPANESEQFAAEQIVSQLRSTGGEDMCFVLTNVSFCHSAQRPADELDIVVVRSCGVQLVEVKHWDLGYIKRNRHVADHEADKLTGKVKRLATTLRRGCDVGRLDGFVLLTNEEKRIPEADSWCRGVQFFGRKEIATLLQPNQVVTLTTEQMQSIVGRIMPAGGLAAHGRIRRLREFVDLEPAAEGAGDRFHRVYRGVHAPTGDRVIIHVYDLSASLPDQGKVDPLTLARREFEVHLKLQRSKAAAYMALLRDSFQDLPEYPGEMAYFTIFELSAPTLATRANDTSWTQSQRLAFAIQAMRGLECLHHPGVEGLEAVVHRNLNPRTIYVTTSNDVRFGGFGLARIDGPRTLAGLPPPTDDYVAPELRQGAGLAAADCRSDLYSLCRSLSELFPADVGHDAKECRRILAKGLVTAPEQRPTAEQLMQELEELRSIPSAASAVSVAELPSPRFWGEHTEVEFRKQKYRILNRLGEGGIGITFKVVRVGLDGEDQGTYVGKIILDRGQGAVALKSYARVRPLTGRNHLSVVFEHADEWHEKQFVALLKWVEGRSLATLNDGLAELGNGDDQFSPDALAMDWCRQLCEALKVLHEAGLVHGDVSPENIIQHQGELVLTDYDLVTPRGEKPPGCGKLQYCSRQVQRGEVVECSDDVYALATTLARVLLGRAPFPEQQGGLDKTQCVICTPDEESTFPRFSAFLRRATDPDRTRRFPDARAALAWVSERPEEVPVPARTPNEVPWLKQLLLAYPGSRYGNIETRGLDSEFAADTYVETKLEDRILDDLRERRTRLLILTGNAGDGKTAMLQHLTMRLGMGQKQSAERQWCDTAATPSGPLAVHINLDGSASHAGQSADQLLDEFLQPYFDGPPATDVAHLLAINDGRLAEWLAHHQTPGTPPTSLVSQLTLLLQDSRAAVASHIRFVNLNLRSLVGSASGTDADADFILRLMAKFLGGENAESTWQPCQTCTAASRCHAWAAVQLLQPGDNDAAGQAKAGWFRKRLVDAFQAVHMRAETHLTTRELRAGLSYILFNVVYCTDLHHDPALVLRPLWDLAFDPASPQRQGELLHEMTWLDPALDADPVLDRYLLGSGSYDSPGGLPRYPDLSLARARRRAYFEWDDDQARRVMPMSRGIGLFRGADYELFRMVPTSTVEEREELCRRLCGGIARLEDLPEQAYQRAKSIGAVPLRLLSRTPTESLFWVEKRTSAFRLEADIPVAASDIPFLHRQLRLIYHLDSDEEEVLSMGYELFHTLLDLDAGYQLADVDSDDLFANLETFVRRLAQEDAQRWFAWNPRSGDRLFSLHTAVVNGKQKLHCSPVVEEMTR